MKRDLFLLSPVVVVFGLTFWWAALLLVGTRPPERIVCPCPGPCPCKESPR